jgi:hypothetical protein
MKFAGSPNPELQPVESKGLSLRAGGDKSPIIESMWEVCLLGPIQCLGMLPDYPLPISRRRIWIARGIAVAADALQIAVFPIFSEGFISPVSDVLDVAVCTVLTLLVGWHIAFLPSFIIKVLPIADLAPTWTIAILIATRHSQQATEDQKKLGASEQQK